MRGVLFPEQTQDLRSAHRESQCERDHDASRLHHDPAGIFREPLLVSRGGDHERRAGAGTDRVEGQGHHPSKREIGVRRSALDRDDEEGHKRGGGQPEQRSKKVGRNEPRQLASRRWPGPFA